MCRTALGMSGRRLKIMGKHCVDKHQRVLSDRKDQKHEIWGCESKIERKNREKRENKRKRERENERERERELSLLLLSLFHCPSLSRRGTSRSFERVSQDAPSSTRTDGEPGGSQCRGGESPILGEIPRLNLLASHINELWKCLQVRG